MWYSKVDDKVVDGEKALDFIKNYSSLNTSLLVY